MKILRAIVGVAVLSFSAAASATDNWSGLRTVTSITAIPPEILGALSDLCRPCTFADFNARWNPTDVLDKDLPQRRLLRIGHSDTEWVIEYEHGGRGRHNHSVTFGLKPSVHFIRGSSCQPSKAQQCEW